MADEYKLKTIVLRDLEPLLRENIDERLIVDSFTTESLLPPGENYGSTILSVHAVIRKNEDAPKEDLFLIAKMSPPTDYQKRIFDSAYTFRKETHMYVDILPAYNKFEIECGIKEDQVFDILPKFYGMRLSLDPKSDLDDDAVILLENLKKKGYYIGKRAIGCDYEHSKVFIQASARFHAIGMALKYKKPEVFQILRQHTKCFNLITPDLDVKKDLLEYINNDPILKPYRDRCDKAFGELSVAEIWRLVPEEPWSTIVHGDSWVNNIMFHRGENGRVDDVKFVDFQNYLFANPISELIFYLFSSGDEDVQKNHIEELMDLYYDCFICHLTRFGCDTTPFAREKFNDQLRVNSQLVFMHLAFMMKVLTMNIEEIDFNYDKIQNLIMDYQGNHLYIKRLRILVLDFVDRNWI